ncbi:MAG: hypothetical protein ABII00_14895 [Elusimicrobiota bacterium]
MIDVPQPVPPPPAPRSAFVTGLAWCAIVFAVLGVVSAVSQSLMLSAMFPGDDLDRLLGRGGAVGELPALFRFIFPRLRLIAGFSLILAVATLVSGIGLLMRRNWARIAFIVLLALSIVMNVGAFVMVQTTFSAIPPIPAEAGMPSFQAFLGIVRLVASAAVVAGTAMIGWIVFKLATKPIVSEFT